MSVGLWRVLLPDGSVRLARGEAEAGPAELLRADADLDRVLAESPDALGELLVSKGVGEVPPGSRALVPLQGQEVWAAGVTFERSRDARKEESDLPDHYDKVYDAKRPELFLKALPGRVRGPGEPIGIRADSTWDVPEPELAVVADASGRLVAYSVGNDVSSRSIEGENPLYLPQAKVYRGSAALGPCLVPVAEAPPFETLSVTLEISRDDNTIFQDSVSLVTMRRRPDELLSWLFLAEDFPVGVALLTGTSIVPGPELTLRPKDRVAISISGVGTLVNTVEVVGGSA
jgi:2-dehydro-3-deoxy-D-arabinonate dehydratase